MKIRDTFDANKNIDRRIEKVISYAADDPERLLTEVSEYVVTENIESNFERLLEHMQDAMDTGGVNEIGVWVSGFYGSGKSSFTKYLAFALDEARIVDGKPFLEKLTAQFERIATQQLLKKLAKNYSAVVIPIDLGGGPDSGSYDGGNLDGALLQDAGPRWLLIRREEGSIPGASPGQGRALRRFQDLCPRDPRNFLDRAPRTTRWWP